MNSEDFKQNIFLLSERLFPMVARMLGSSEAAEDALQEIMIKLWIKRNSIAKHPNLTGLVFLTARNHCLDVLKQKKQPHADYSLHDKLLNSVNGHEHLDWKELHEMIKKILDTLPEQHKEILVMRDIDGYEFTEIAGATELNIKHVRVLLSRARKQVRIQINKIYCYDR